MSVEQGTMVYYGSCTTTQLRSNNFYSGNPSITDTFGEHCFSHYTEVAFVKGLFCTQTVQGAWLLYITVGLSSVVAVKRSSTVLI